MSAGVFGRPMGIGFAMRAIISSLLMPCSAARVFIRSSTIAVKVTPGQTAFTLMLCWPSCCAACFVMEMTAPLLAA